MCGTTFNCIPRPIVGLTICFVRHTFGSDSSRTGYSTRPCGYPTASYYWTRAFGGAARCPPSVGPRGARTGDVILCATRRDRPMVLGCPPARAGSAYFRGLRRATSERVTCYPTPCCEGRRAVQERTVTRATRHGTVYYLTSGWSITLVRRDGL